MPMPWSKDNCKILINATLGNEEVKSIEVHDLDCPPEAASELLELLSSQRFPQDGLSVLILEWFKPSIKTLNQDLLSKLAQRSSQRLQMLSVRGMCYLSSEARGALSQMVSQILEARPPLTHLSLSYFSKGEDPAHGKLIIEALACSSIATLTFLRLDGNSSWWTIRECRGLLTVVEKRQTNLLTFKF